jgi:hypothetical protein
VVLRRFHPAAAKKTIIMDCENPGRQLEVSPKQKNWAPNLTIFHAAMAMRYRQLGLGTGQVDFGLIGGRGILAKLSSCFQRYGEIWCAPVVACFSGTGADWVARALNGRYEEAVSASSRGSKELELDWSWSGFLPLDWKPYCAVSRLVSSISMSNLNVDIRIILLLHEAPPWLRLSNHWLAGCALTGALLIL